MAHEKSNLYLMSVEIEVLCTGQPHAHLLCNFHEPVVEDGDLNHIGRDTKMLTGNTVSQHSGVYFGPNVSIQGDGSIAARFHNNSAVSRAHFFQLVLRVLSPAPRKVNFASQCHGKVNSFGNGKVVGLQDVSCTNISGSDISEHDLTVLQLDPILPLKHAHKLLHIKTVQANIRGEFDHDGSVHAIIP